MMRIFIFVNLKKLLYLKIYILLILNEIQKHKFFFFKALKTIKLDSFLRQILSCKQIALVTHHLRRHDESSHLVASIAAALNWTENAMIGGGGGFPHSTDGLLNAGPTASTCGPSMFGL